MKIGESLSHVVREVDVRADFWNTFWLEKFVLKKDWDFCPSLTIEKIAFNLLRENKIDE